MGLYRNHGCLYRIQWVYAEYREFIQNTVGLYRIQRVYTEYRVYT